MPRTYKASERASGIVSFRASNRVTVRIRDVTKVANVIDVLVGAGANEIGGINFTVTQASKHLDEAREKAIADARRKAEIYAKAAGVTLGEPISISEETGSPGPLFRSKVAAGALSLAGRKPVGCAQPCTIGGAGAAAGRNQVAGGCPDGGKSPAPAPPPPAASVQTADPFGEEFTLEPKKVVVIKGTANWDAAFDTLIDSFKALTALLDKQGIKATGNSMIVYTSTDDTGFTFLAEIPVDQDAEEPDQGHEHGQIARGQGAEVRPSRLLRQHGQHL